MAIPRVVPPEAWRGAGTLAHARALLGKFLVRTRVDGTTDARVICEVEAYDGAADRACHASRGRTPRTAVMFGPGGVWYVYLCYGVHEMLNLVVGPAGWPAAVLVRGLADVNGPGRVTRALAIDRALDGAPALPASGLHLEDRGVVVPDAWVRRSRRIGVDYAGPVWSAKPWRLFFDPRRLDPAFVTPPPGPKKRALKARR